MAGTVFGGRYTAFGRLFEDIGGAFCGGAKTKNMEARNEARTAQLLRELASDLSDMVRSGDITENQANQWMADKQDQWMGGDR